MIILPTTNPSMLSTLSTQELLVLRAEAQQELRTLRDSWEHIRLTIEQSLLDAVGGFAGIKQLGPNEADRARTYALALERDENYTDTRNLVYAYELRVELTDAYLTARTEARRTRELAVREQELLRAA